MRKPVTSSSPTETPGNKATRKLRSPAPALSLAYPYACGIDIGSISHFVAVPADRDDDPVREFRAFTADLQSLIDWLRQCRITAVAMESTGVYWIALYEKLDAAGFELQLVNSRHDEHLFACGQSLALIGVYASQIAKCDAELARLFCVLKTHELPDDGLGAPKRGTPARSSVHFDARAALFEASGVDLTRIPGIDTSTAPKVISEIGVDLQRFPTVKHCHLMDGLVSGHQNIGRQGSVERDQAMRQPRRSGAAKEQFGARVVLAGAATNWCIRATAYGALERGYDLTLVNDAHTTGSMVLDDGTSVQADSVIRELNIAMTWLSYPGRKNGTAMADAVDFASPGAVR